MNKLSHLLKNPNEFLKTPENRAILGGLLLLAIIIIFVVFSYVGNINKEKKDVSPNQKVVGEVKTNLGEPEEFEHDKVYSHSGKVLSIEGDKILFETTYINDLKIIEAVLEAKVKPGAEISKRDLYALYKAGPDAEHSVGRETITLKDIKAGDQIMVISNSNIKNKSSFEVDSVELQYYSQRI